MKRTSNFLKVAALCLCIAAGTSQMTMGQTVVQSWNIGSPVAANVKATLYSDSTFIISGSGNIANYSSSNYAPWYSSYRNHIKTIVIGDSVTSIGDIAFRDCSSLTSVTIGNGVTSIGDIAFYGCSGLTSLTIGNSVTSIGVNTFNACSSLTSVSIPNSVTSIGSSAFAYCSGLTSVIIPNSVTSLGSSAFNYCSSLTSINVDNNNSIYSSIDGILYNKMQDTLILCPEGKTGTVSIPNSVTSIRYNAFYGCSGLTSVSIPNSVTSIGSSAFYNCSGLISVSIPNSVTSIGSSAFYNCSGLISVSIPNSVASIGGYTFYGCSSLTSVIIPNSVISIGDNAFSICIGLTSLTIPNSVTTIGSNAFASCRGLTSVTIGNSVISIGNAAFWNCSSLQTVNFNAINCTTIGSTSYPVFQGCTAFTTLNIGDSVKTIINYAFSGCSSLTSVTISGNTSIGYAVFQNCSGLTSLTLSMSSIRGESCLDTPDFAILGDLFGTVSDSNMQAVTQYYYVFAALERIESKTFYLPKNLSKLVVTGVHRYGLPYGAFSGCSMLQEITLPSTLKTIHGRAFSDCSSLTSITIPDSVTTIRDSVFLGCSGLSSIAIPSSVTTIGDYAFFGCSSLTAIDVESNNSYYASEDGILFNKEETRLIQCPGGKTGFVHVPVSVNNITNYAFQDCSNLTSITIENHRIDFPPGLFSGCSGLTSLALPHLKSSSFSSSDTLLLGYLFGTISNSNMQAVTQYYNATESRTYYLPKNLSRLAIQVLGSPVVNSNYGILYGCSMLEEVIFVDIHPMGEKTLYGCTGLKHIYYLLVDLEQPPAPAYDNTTFYGIDKSNCILHLPLGSQSKFAVADGWKEFFNVQEDADILFNSITTKDLPNGIIGSMYNVTLTGGGYDPVTWSIKNGNLPTGLSLSTNGVISGIPTVTGQFDFVVEINTIDPSFLWDWCWYDNSKRLSIVITDTAVGIVETNNYPSLRVYPNPTMGQLTIDNGQLTIGNIEIFNIVGQVVLSTEALRSLMTLESGEITIDVSHLANGMYFLKVGNQVVRFLKE